MDRNRIGKTIKYTLRVALRKESVDRNTKRTGKVVKFSKSLSARRAWIEIPILLAISILIESLSARRAWIEIKYAL